MKKSSKSTVVALIVAVVGLAAALVAIVGIIMHYRSVIESLLCTGEDEEFDELIESDL